jgi:hypothetical protein
MLFGTNSAERMRITAAGDVGIGLTSPGARLDASMGHTTSGLAGVVAFPQFAVTNPANWGFPAGMLFRAPLGTGGAPANNAAVWAEWSSDNNAYLGFATTFSGTLTERMRLDTSGNLLVGTTTQLSGERLGVNVVGASANAFGAKNDAGAGAPTAFFWNAATTGDNVFLHFNTDANGALRGSVTYNRAGGLVAYNTTSDYRAKDILGPVADAGGTIDALKVYNGKMHEGTVERPMLIAHEAQEVAPYAVTGEKDAVDEDGAPLYQQIDHQSLIPLLIAELQSLRARVAQLEGN